MGPINRIMAKFEIRWFQSACPATWVKSRNQLRTCEKLNWFLPGIRKKLWIKLGKKVLFKSRIRAENKEKLKIAGELYFIFAPTVLIP